MTPESILAETVKNLYDGVPLEEVLKSAILAARALIEQDPAYSYVTARLLLHTMRREVLGEEVTQAAMAERYAEYFPKFIRYGIEADVRVMSAHRTPAVVAEFASSARESGYAAIICGAGMAAHAAVADGYGSTTTSRSSASMAFFISSPRVCEFGAWPQ